MENIHNHNLQEEIDQFDCNDENDTDVSGFMLGDGFPGGGDFDDNIGSLFLSSKGDTIPDVLINIQSSLETLTKTLYKLTKVIETHLQKQ
jgi:hypothetical protein